MTVIEIGDMLTRNGERLCGILVEASRDELQAVAGNVLYKEVEVTPCGERTDDDVFLDKYMNGMVSRLCEVDQRVREAKASRKYTRDEVLAFLDEIDPGGKGGEK